MAKRSRKSSTTFAVSAPTPRGRAANTFRLGCDIHGWTTGWVIVTEDPFVVVTDSMGAFKLTGVPAGTYKLEVWHPVLGAQTKDVTVTDGAEAKVNFELAVK